MKPTTQQATSLEVEGNTTVEVTGTDGQGNQLEGDQVIETEEQTADTTTENVEPEETEEQSVDEGVSSKDQDLSDGTRHVKRTEKLIDKLKERTDEASALRRQLEELRGNPFKQEETQLPPWLNNTMPQDEITPEQYQAQVVGTARELVKTELSNYQSKVLKYESFKDDVNKVEAKYPILNQDSDVYDAKKSDQIAKLYKAASDGDPTLRFSEFVESVMSFHEAGQETGREAIKASVIRKEAESAVTPNQTTVDSNRKSDDWDTKTLKEKEDWMKANGIWD